MIENKNTRHPRIVASTFRKTNTFLGMVKTKPHLEMLSRLLKNSTFQNYFVPRETHVHDGDFMESLEVSHRSSKVM
jgi:hypothetical protein